jgi:hypothetical protein
MSSTAATDCALRATNTRAAPITASTSLFTRPPPLLKRTHCVAQIIRPDNRFVAFVCHVTALRQLLLGMAAAQLAGEDFLWRRMEDGEAAFVWRLVIVAKPAARAGGLPDDQSFLRTCAHVADLGDESVERSGTTD